MLAHSFLIKVAGNQDRHKSSDEFDFGPLVSLAHLYFFFWNEIWPWHIGLRWAIVAFWATCLVICPWSVVSLWSCLSVRYQLAKTGHNSWTVWYVLIKFCTYTLSKELRNAIFHCSRLWRRARYWRTIMMGYIFGLSEAICSNLKPINYFVIMRYICFENVNDKWLEDHVKSEADAQKLTVLLQKCSLLCNKSSIVGMRRRLLQSHFDVNFHRS